MLLLKIIGAIAIALLAIPLWALLTGFSAYQVVSAFSSGEILAGRRTGWVTRESLPAFWIAVAFWTFSLWINMVGWVRTATGAASWSALFAPARYWMAERSANLALKRKLDRVIRQRTGRTETHFGSKSSSRLSSSTGCCRRGRIVRTRRSTKRTSTPMARKPGAKLHLHSDKPT